MKLGRPTGYKPEYCDCVDHYLAQAKDEEIDYVTMEGRAGTGYQKRVKVNLPTIEGFAIFLDVAVSSLYLWANDHKDFSEALGRIKQEQKNRLISRGLSGDYNSTIAKLVLAANHDMRDKQDVTSDGKALPTPILANVPSNDGDAPGSKP